MHARSVPHPICESCDQRNGNQADQSSISESARTETKPRFGRAGRRCADRSNKTITVPIDCFYESGTIGRISQSIAHLFDRVVQALIKADIYIGRPNLLPELLPRDDLTSTINQQRKDSKWLVLQLDLNACLMQFAGRQVELKYAEANNIGERTRCLHDGSRGNHVLPAKKVVQKSHNQVSRYCLVTEESAT
jgi:hypothetical protein